MPIASSHPDLADEFPRRLRGELPADFPDQADAYIADCVAAANDVLRARRPSSRSMRWALTCPNYWAALPISRAPTSPCGLVLRESRWRALKAITSTTACESSPWRRSEWGGFARWFYPHGATFLIFMEYARNAVRMSALMGQRVLYVFTHDSIGLGEDGPTPAGGAAHSAARHAQSADLAAL